jgi:hypothetical protein
MATYCSKTMQMTKTGKNLVLDEKNCPNGEISPHLIKLVTGARMGSRV